MIKRLDMRLLFVFYLKEILISSLVSFNLLRRKSNVFLTKVSRLFIRVN
jgi:hypothetical protein